MKTLTADHGTLNPREIERVERSGGSFRDQVSRAHAIGLSLESICIFFYVPRMVSQGAPYTCVQEDAGALISSTRWRARNDRVGDSEDVSEVE